MITVDIAADLNDEDENGFVWTYLDDARDPDLIRPGNVVIAGDADTPAVCEVIDLVMEPSGTIVHLRLLPGTIEDYEALVRRAGIPACSIPAIMSAPRRAASAVASGTRRLRTRTELSLGTALYLQSVIVVFCAEINAVRARRLWPRNLLAPFVDDVVLTPADRVAYRSDADAERHKPSAQVYTTFEHPPSKNDQH